MVPKSLNTEMARSDAITTSKMEFSEITMSALRTMMEHIDKSVVVVGGFNKKTVEEAEALVQQMMVDIEGYKSVKMIDGESPLGLETFDSPMQAMKFIGSQKKNGTIHTNKFWVS